MGRPPRQRVVTGQPMATVYKPAGIPARQLQWVNLTLDEFEAIRLIDGEGLDQETAAGQMGVSRPTVTRILGSGRSKIARVISHGQALVIQGGPVVGPVVGPVGMGPRAPVTGPVGGVGFGGGGRGRGRHGRGRGRPG